MTKKSRNSRVLYTALVGGYENLNEIEIHDDTVDKICFTDDRSVTSSTWQIIHVDLPFPLDFFRSQRYFKVLGHPALKHYEEWLYIDNTVALKQKPSEILDRWLNSKDLAIASHSFRESLNDEFTEVLRLELDSDERVREQLLHYEELYPKALTKRPFWNGIIARRNTPEIAEWSMIWWQHILRYSRRDQLSLLVALEIAKVQISRIKLDNNQSKIHFWPIESSRKTEMRTTSIPNYRKIAVGLETELEVLNEKYDGILNSSSWKITQPLRKLSARFKSLFPK